MALPDDILPDDEAAEGGAAPEAEQPSEPDTLQAQFDSMAEATQREFEANNHAPNTPQTPDAPPETPAQPPSEPPAAQPVARNHWNELRQRGEEESGVPPIAEQRQQQPAPPPSEPPATLQDYMEQGGQIPDFAAEGDGNDEQRNWHEADLRHKTLVTDKLLDHTQQINMLIRRLELGGL